MTGSGSSRVTYFVADVTLADVTELRSGFAGNKFGRNIVADTSDIAASYEAVFAINGDYYGFRDNGILIRNGVLYRDDGARMGLAIHRDGTMEVYDERTTTGEKLLVAGVWNTLSIGPGLVVDGGIVTGIDEGRSTTTSACARSRETIPEPASASSRRTTSSSSWSTAGAAATAGA